MEIKSYVMQKGNDPSQLCLLCLCLYFEGGRMEWMNGKKWSWVIFCCFALIEYKWMWSFERMIFEFKEKV